MHDLEPGVLYNVPVIWPDTVIQREHQQGTEHRMEPKKETQESLRHDSKMAINTVSVTGVSLQQKTFSAYGKIWGEESNLHYEICLKRQNISEVQT